MSERDELDGIAIIGMSGRFPKAGSVDEFWRNLLDGRECVSFPSDQELLDVGIEQADLDMPNYVRAGCYLEDTDKFDAAFFGISPKEAELMDPQHRIFLEVAWEAMENAGYNPATYEGEVGVWSGCSLSTYMLYNLDTHLGRGGSLPTVIGNDKDYLSTRVSYKLNLRGPSCAVQSACSTSLVAVSLACDALLDYQCSMALAGGIATRSPAKMGYVYEQGSILSPDGHCRTFDAKAEGTIFGSGAGVVVLKRLADAVEDGDTIYAVIKGSAVNNDGNQKVGYTAPSVEGQARVVAMAQAMAGVSPDTISYVEAHGTGTALGDPIEVAALTQAFRTGTQRKGYCAIGSVKTNVGHLDTAAGVAGLIKAALAMKHEVIPASINFETPNPDLDLENSPFYVNDRLSPWKSDGAPRRAGVSAFGIGGTNAHVVIEEAPKVDASGPSRSRQLLVLSGRTASALETATSNLADHLEKNPGASLADVAYTLGVGRVPFGNRRMLVCASVEDAVAALRSADPKRVLTRATETEERPVAFMFPGQGAQYANMGRELYEAEPTFRAEVDRCAAVLEPHLRLDLRTVLFPAAGGEEEAAERLRQTALTQPALFVVEYALARTLLAWGLTPSAMIGHSVGEYVAACLAGVFSLEDALALVAARGELMQQLPSGAMLAVSLAEGDLLPLLGEELSLAAVNGSSLCVVSGRLESIEAFQHQLAERQVEFRTLHTSHAFHSEMMDPILAGFTDRVRRVRLAPPTVPFVSNVTGTWITDAEATDPAYWAKHLRQTVRFADGVEALAGDPERVLLEVGPGRTLSTLARRHPKRAAGQVSLATMRHPDDPGSDQELLLSTLGKLWLEGVPVRWEGFYGGERRQRVPLPTYPFERQRYWMELRNSATAQAAKAAAAARPERRRAADLSEWFYVPSWKRSAPPAAEAGGPGAVVIFADECGVGDRLAARLEAAGRDVVVVRPGTAFEKTSERELAIDPTSADDCAALFDALGESGRGVGRVVHMWSVTPAHPGALDADALARAQDRGFYSLLALAQALGRRDAADGVSVTVVSSGLHDVSGDEAIDPAKATLLGPVRVIPQEYPGVACRAVDVVAPEADTPQADRLAGQLYAEVAGASADKIVALRGGHRWVQTFEPMRLGAASEAAPTLKHEGVYLITGGLGGVGLTLAEDLARRVRAKLILTGRSALPDRAEWDARLAEHGASDDLARKIAKVRELEGLGAEVMVASADVASRDDMAAVVRGALERFGRIDGVVHAAGVPGGGVIQRKTREVAEGVMSPKLAGTLALDAAIEGLDLDFFVLCSSAGALVGGFGQVDYCAANNFLDAFARRKNMEGRVHTVSVNWDAWKEVGMAAEAAKAPAGPASSEAVETAVEPASEAVSHPLFAERILEGADREVYVSRFRVDKDWVLADHKITGVATLPGTAYLEIVRAAVELHAGEGAAVELRDVFFLAPLMVAEGEEKEVRTVLQKAPDGFRFSVLSRVEPGADRWQEHATGGAAAVEAEPPIVYDLGEIEARCGAQDVAITEAERDAQSGFMEFGPRWNNLKRIRFGADRGLASLELPEAFAGDVERFKLHPAMMDSATGFLSVRAEGGGPHLPFSYGRIRVKGALPATAFSYARFAADNQPKSGTVKLDITVLDARGRGLVEIEGYMLRKVDVAKREAAAAEAASRADAENFTLEISTPGILENLGYRPAERPAPGPGEVEIEVAATGLNFKEVLMALGMMPVPPGAGAGFGLECAGRVARVGEGVEGFAEGDAVYALARPCFSPYVTAQASYTARVPAHMSMEEAATIPVAFLTAYFSLVTLGRLQRGERVLVHAAAGGVGLAALQVAKWVGAEIFATAGSDEKRDVLRSLGVEHVMDSRKSGFGAEIARVTGGRGVDAVLNSLGGDFIAEGLEALAPFGRFLEIGKRDIYADTPIGLRPFEKGLSFYAIDIGPRDTADMRRAWGELVALFESRTLEPLRRTVFPIDDVSGAFELMSRAKHIGKIVVSLEDKEAIRRLASRSDAGRPGAAAPGWRAASSALSRVEQRPAGRPAGSYGAAAFADGMTPAEGAAAFRRLLSAPVSQIAVSPRDLPTLAERGISAEAVELAAAPEDPAQYRPSHPRPALASAFTAPRSETEETIARIWQHLLGIEQVGVFDDFYELGGDSLLATQVVARLREAFGLEIAVAKMFEEPTIAGLAEFVDAGRWAAQGAPAAGDEEREEGLI